MEPKNAWEIMKAYVERNKDNMSNEEIEAYKIVFVDDIRLGIINGITQGYVDELDG